LSQSSSSFDDDLRSSLNIGLNEATFLNLRINPDRALVDLLFSVLTLPEEGPEPEDPRIMVRLQGVGRIAASLRHGLWNDDSAEVESSSLDQLSDVVLSFKGVPIYGWDFIDPSDGSWERWKNRLSLDEHLSSGGTEHCIDLFQAGGTARHLDLRVWFDDLTLCDMTRNVISIQEFGAGGRRWWDALYAGDERVQGHGIGPLRNTD
jgi:hypothetical protein